MAKLHNIFWPTVRWVMYKTLNKIVQLIHAARETHYHLDVQI